MNGRDFLSLTDQYNLEIAKVKMSKKTFFQKMFSMCYLSGGGALVYGALSVHNNNEPFYRDVLMPLVSTLDPELSHRMAVAALRLNLLPENKTPDPPVLRTTFLDRELENPIGIAAGFDKDGEAIAGLRRLGFGCVEIGSVTPEPQPGNARPRVFRLPEDAALVNRYGFNSAGRRAVADRLEGTDRLEGGCLGVNLGKNKSSEDALRDYVAGIETFAFKADYLVVNISSPNTPGLRSLQSKQHLYKLLAGVASARDSLAGDRRPRIFLKIAPDLSAEERRDIVDVLRKKECRIDGLIISNTTTRRDGLKNENHAREEGGLSGAPLKDVSTRLIREFYKETGGRMPIIGVGGVSSGRDAYEKILAGATVVQLYTAFAYGGPPVVARIKAELSELLTRDGHRNVNEAVGKERR